MNGTATKLANRQIRRAFGEEAIDTINTQGETLQSIVLPRLMTLGKTADEVDRRLVSLETIKAQHSIDLMDLALVIERFRTQPRWQRLKWVLGW